MMDYLDCLNKDSTGLLALLHKRVLTQPDQRAITYMGNVETELGWLSYQDLERQAQVIADLIESQGAEDQRALLMYSREQGLEFIASFYGCLYAGVTAIPASPPQPSQSISLLQAIVSDAQATVVLTTTSVLANLEFWLAQAPELAELRWLATDNLASD